MGHSRLYLGHPCLRSAGGRLLVSGCNFMAEGKQQIVLEKGLKAAAIMIIVATMTGAILNLVLSA